MRTMLSIVFILSFLGAVAGDTCPREHVPHWALQDQDGDAFSLMQSNSARHVVTVDGNAVNNHLANMHVSANRSLHAASVQTKSMNAASISTRAHEAAQRNSSQIQDFIRIVPVILVLAAVALVGLYSRVGGHAQRFVFADKRNESKLSISPVKISKPVKEVAKSKPGVPSHKAQSPSVASASALKAAYDPSYAPQPLCPTLVLPASESRFAVSMRDLANVGTHGELKVYGISGKPLLIIRIKDGTSLDVSLATSSIMPRCTIRVPAQPDSPFEILGVKNAPYGQFHCSSKGLNEVVVKNRTILLVEGDSSSLQFSVATPSGTSVALARINTEDYGDGDHLEIRAFAGTDSILVIAAVMSLAIFKSSDKS